MQYGVERILTLDEITKRTRMGFPYDLYEVKNDFYLKYGNESKAKNR